jgi:hypothetical protein
MADLPESREILHRMLDELTEFIRDMDQGRSVWDACYKLLLAERFLDVPRKPEDVLDWIKRNDGRLHGRFRSGITDRVRELHGLIAAKVSRSKASEPTPKPEGEASKTVPAKPLKEPSRRAFAAYRLTMFGRDTTQTEAGEKLGVSQTTISNYVKAVGEWIAAGNVLPDELAAKPLRPKMITMDPGKLEQGPRRRGRE